MKDPNLLYYSGTSDSQAQWDHIEVSIIERCPL